MGMRLKKDKHCNDKDITSVSILKQLNITDYHIFEGEKIFFLAFLNPCSNYLTCISFLFFLLYCH